MRSSVVRRLIVVGAILAWPVAGYAQEIVGGTVTDATGLVLPGVTVTATLEATGNNFTAVTDATGAYRITLRPGVYQIRAEKQGSPPLVRPGVRVMVGQELVVNLRMGASAEEQEAVREAGSGTSANIDERVQSDLPVQGRNPMDLNLVAAGIRSNAATEVPQARQGFFQINLDGQQVTQLICCNTQQPRYSRDAIAQQQVVTQRFDATLGRTQGMVVNAVTKSGTNSFTGALSGFFRSDKLNAADHVQGEVIPYSNQQISAVYGGPIRKDRVHFFASYEYEREPQTAVYDSVYPAFNVNIPKTRKQWMTMVRGDFEFSPDSRLMTRYSKYYQLVPQQGGSTVHPSGGHDTNRYSDQVWGVWTKVISSGSVNSLKGGFSFFEWNFAPDVKWTGPGLWADPSITNVLGGGTPRFNFSGYSIGTATNSPQDLWEKVFTVRDDFVTSFNKGGRHDLSLGAEYLRWDIYVNWCNRCVGTFRMNARPPANIQELFPVWNDTSTWNLDALSPLIINYEQSIGDMEMTPGRNMYAFYAQDDWAVSSRMTLNLGVRYDVDFSGRGEKIQFLPWESGHRPSDKNNVAPRLGVSYRLNDRTVLRGGYGVFYTQLEADAVHQTTLWTKEMIPQLLNDGRPDFASNPFNGPIPTYEQALANACDQNNSAPGCYKRAVTIEIPAPSEKGMKPLHSIGFSHQATVGIERQLTDTMAFRVDLAWTGGRQEETHFNMNLDWNPATGANYPFTDVSHLPFPDWGLVLGEYMIGRSDYRGLQMAFQKRYSNRWQANATYTLSDFRSADGNPVQVLPDGDSITYQPLNFSVQPDIANDYTLAESDQRHRATVNGIWDLGAGFQLSGLYFFGSGERFFTYWGGDRRSNGFQTNSRLRPDGTIVPRAELVGKPIHRVDMRLTKRVNLGGQRTLEGIVEMFNVLDHANFGRYTVQRSSARYGQPIYSSNTSYAPRSMQLAFRITF
jgi:hypothetical protein